MADASYQIQIEGKQAENTISSIEKKVSELSENLKECAIGSKEFADTQSELRKYQTQLEGVNQTSVQIGDNIAKAATGIVGGFQAAEGALALFGVESEAVQESIQRMQALMSLSQGIKGITEGVKSFKLLTSAVGVSSKGLGTFKKALIGTGLGAIVVVLGSIIANWDEFTKAIGLSEEALLKMGQVFSGVMKVITNSLKGIVTALAKLFRRDYDGALEELRKGFDFTASYNEGVQEKIVQQNQEAAQKASDAWADAAKKRLEQLDIQAAKAKAEIEDEKKLNEELLRIEQERLKTFAKGTKEYYDQIAKIKEMSKTETEETSTESTTETEETSTESTEPDFSKYESDLVKIELINARLEESSRTAEENEINRLTDKYQTELALLEKYGLDTEALTARYEAQKTAITDKYSKERLKQKEDEAAKEKQVIQQQINAASELANGLSDILGAIAGAIDTTTEEGFEQAKKLQIAQATINMITGIATALSGAFTTKTGPWDIAIAAVQAASIAASGIANIAKIKNTKFESAGSGGATATTSSSAVNATLVAPTQYSQEISNARLEESIGDTRVYVTEGDIASTSKKVSVAEAESRY